MEAENSASAVQAMKLLCKLLLMTENDVQKNILHALCISGQIELPSACTRLATGLFKNGARISVVQNGV